MSQIFDLGHSFIFMTLNVNNRDKIIFLNFYITYKLNKGLYQKFETCFPRGMYKEHILGIWHILRQFHLGNRCSKKKGNYQILSLTFCSFHVPV